MSRSLFYSFLIVILSASWTWALPIQFDVTPLTPAGTTSVAYTQASINGPDDVVYVKTGYALRAMKSDGTGDSSLGLAWPSLQPAVNNVGDFLSVRGTSTSRKLWLSTLSTAPTGVDLTDNALYTGSDPNTGDLNDLGQIVFRDNGNNVWLTDTAGTFFTNMTSQYGLASDQSRVSINNNGQIVYSKDGDIFLTDTSGSTPTNLTASLGANLRDPDINNNGVVAALCVDTGAREAWLLDVFGSAPVKLTDYAVDGEASSPQINDLEQLVIPLDPPEPDLSYWSIFLYTPIPEPTSMLLLLCGIAFVAYKKRQSNSN